MNFSQQIIPVILLCLASRKGIIWVFLSQNVSTLYLLLSFFCGVKMFSSGLLFATDGLLNL